MTAEERGMELMLMPMKELPTLAFQFAKKLCIELTGCGEVFLTAYTVYAQCVEGLECTDGLYKARDVDVDWFNEHKDKTV